MFRRTLIGEPRPLHGLISLLVLGASLASSTLGDSAREPVPVSDVRLLEVALDSRSIESWEAATFPRIIRVFPNAKGEATAVYQGEAQRLVLCDIRGSACRVWPAYDESGGPISVTPLSPFSVTSNDDHVLIGLVRWRTDRSSPDATSLELLEYERDLESAPIFRTYQLPPKPNSISEGLVPIAAIPCDKDEIAICLVYSERHFDPAKLPDNPYDHFVKYCSLWYAKGKPQYQSIVRPGAFEASGMTIRFSSDGVLHAVSVETQAKKQRIQYSTNKHGTGWSSPEVVESRERTRGGLVSHLDLAVSQDGVHVIWAIGHRATYCCSRLSSGFSEPVLVDKTRVPLGGMASPAGGVSIVLEGRNEISLVQVDMARVRCTCSLVSVPAPARLRRCTSGFDHDGNVHLVFFVASEERSGHYQYGCFQCGR